MSDQGNSYSPDKASRSYMMSAVIFAALIAAAAFLHFTVANREKALVQTAAAAQHELALTQRIAMLTAEYEVTHEESVLSDLKETATATLNLHESLMPTVMGAMSHGTLADQASMQAGSVDTQVRDLASKALTFAANADSAQARDDAEQLVTLARQTIAMSWDTAVTSYLTGAQKDIDMLTKISFGLYAAMLAVLFYELSALFAPAVAQIRAQRDHLEKMGSTDLLTGFYNRAMLFKVVATLISGAKRHKQPLTALAVDIDDFKTINDKYGRAAGDSAIKRVGAALNEVLRNSDVMGRVGGEEFAVFLPSTDEYRATYVAEKLRAAIEGLNFSVKDAVVLLRVSIGVAELQAHHKTTDDVLRAAEAALKTAKDAGRNRVATASGAPVATTAPPPATAPVGTAG